MLYLDFLVVLSTQTEKMRRTKDANLGYPDDWRKDTFLGRLPILEGVHYLTPTLKVDIRSLESCNSRPVPRGIFRPALGILLDARSEIVVYASFFNLEPHD
jgi:hypothetical protein